MDSKAVLDIFKEITTIPRESGHEEAITAWLLSWAENHGLDAKKDAACNVLITREAAAGKENVPTIVLQAHQDMVCEKESGCAHDFSKDPVRYVIEDGWMIAPQTTLGADDGIGIAACLALLEDKTPTGRIECLFTISEETGMDGAEALQPGFFTGKTLINLDSEDEGELFIGCSGGMNTQIRFKFDLESVSKELTVLRFAIRGGTGGHSGDDINKERMNAVQQMARFLYSEFDYGYQLIDLEGGGKPNAIARECTAILATANPSGTIRRFRRFASQLRDEFHVTETGLVFEVSKVKTGLHALDYFSSLALISSLYTCPHGVQAMSQDIPGLVQTSTNLASVSRCKGYFRIVTSQRSPSRSQRRDIAARVRANFEAMGATVRHMYEYPGWEPNPESHVLKVCVDAYEKLFGVRAKVKAIHAGLECGLFLTKFPGLDMISFGPTLRGVHAPGERLELASLDKFVRLLDYVVCNFK